MFLAIDIGGTKTLLALFSHHGLCLKRLKFPTDSDPAVFTKSLEQHLQKFIPQKTIRRHIRAITVAIPGVVKYESNTYSFKLGNLNWPNINLVTPIKNLFNCKFFFVNDADLATLYEASRPKLKSKKTVYLTFSTGIGGGIAKNGKLLNSSNSFEPGHVKYKFQGHTLEWEDIASAKAIVSTYKCPSILNLPLDNATISDLVTRLSLGILDIAKSESPDVIIIGGPIGLIFDKLEPSLSNIIHANLKSKVIFKKAHRPTESVIYGSYLYSKQNYQK